MFKRLFLKWLFEFVGWLLVIVLALAVGYIVDDITKIQYLGIVVVATIYYYCSPIIKPYIDELRNKLLKNIGKKDEEI
jgi:hypothetical protein